MYHAMEILWTGPTRSRATILLAHGAGVGMDSPFMAAFAEGLAERKIRVGRFEFPYMLRRRQTGKKSPPDRAPVLVQAWREAIGQVRSKRLFIGGKSMGGRIASMVVDESRADGLICLGYPFHPAGKPEKLRVEHLQSLEKPALFLQGERDALGNRAEVAGYELSASIHVHWLEDGDHNLKPRKASGRTEEDNWQEAMGEMDKFVAGDTSREA
jgi:predicted alpha/beta-hydrolase family hydrolase